MDPTNNENTKCNQNHTCSMDDDSEGLKADLEISFSGPERDGEVTLTDPPLHRSSDTACISVTQHINQSNTGR